MERTMITNDNFDTLWQQAEAQAFAQRLTREYPAWHRRRQQRRRVAVAVFAMGLVVAAAVPLLRPSSPLGYDRVYTNTSSLSDSQWADLAAAMLTETA